MDRWAKANSILTSMGSDVNGPTLPKDAYTITTATRTATHNHYYYMDESVLLGTKPLVDSIRYSIRDPSGVFSV